MSSPRQSNKAVGDENLARLRLYLERGEIPERRGKVNITALAEAAEVDRQVLYRDEAQGIIRAAVERKHLRMPQQEYSMHVDDIALDKAQREILNLQQRLVAADAELRELRTRMRWYEHIERHMMETGMVPR